MVSYLLGRVAVGVAFQPVGGVDPGAAACGTFIHVEVDQIMTSSSARVLVAALGGHGDVDVRAVADAQVGAA